MTREEIVATLAAIEHHLNSRIVVWRSIIDADGTVVKRVVRRTYTQKEKRHDLSLRNQKD